MKKYLDYSGLQRLWERIKAVFVTRAELEEDEEVIASALTDLNTRLENSAIEILDLT